MADWYRVRTISGKPAGLGFACQICGLSYRAHAPQEIKHCGRTEKAPLITLLLPERSVVEGGITLPRNMILVGDWEVR